MRIGIDLRSLQEKQQAGISRYAYKLCEAIVKQDKENEYFFYFNTARKISYPEFTKSGTVIHNRIPSRIFNLCARFLRIRKWDTENNLDVFWQPSFNFINLSKKVKKVITAHDLSWLINKKWYSHKMLIWHKLVGVRKHITLAEKIVAVSKSTANDLQYFYGVSKDKIRIIYSGIDREEYANDCHEIILPKKYILFIGTVEPRKNILGIIDAMEQMYNEDKFKDVHLVVIGSKGWSNKGVHEAINNSKYADKFHYVGYTSDIARECYLKNCLGLVWPSFYEGFGHPPLEALLHSKQVITSYGSSLPEVVSNNAILIDPYNLMDIKEAIIECLSNTGSVCVDLDKYDWNKAALEYIQLFNSLNK